MKKLCYLPLFLLVSSFTFFSCSSDSTAPAITPANEVDVHVIMGQSNSIGRAYAHHLPKELKTPLDSCFIYNSVSGKFEVIKAGVNTQTAEGMFGPVVKAAQLLSEHKKRRVYFVVAGYGNTQLYYSGSEEEKDWHPDSKELAQQAIATVEQAHKALEADGKKAVFKSIAWWQGERDAMRAEKAALYGANEAALFYSFSSIPYLRNAKRVVFKLFAQPQLMPHVNAINEAKVKRAMSDANTLAVIETSSYELNPQDKLHATAKGMVQAGTDLFEAIKNL